MRRAYIASGVLHVTVVALAFYGLPEILRPDKLDEQVVNVEVVSLKDAAPPSKPEPPKQAPKPPPEPPKAAATPPPPPPQPPEPVKAPEPPAPPPPKPAPIKQPVPPKPKPEPQQARKPAPPTPKPKPAPPPDQLAALLKNLKKEKAQVERQDRKDAKPAPAQPTPAPAPQVASIDQRIFASQLQGLIKSQIEPCWIVPAGARDAGDMKVGIRFTLNPDGSLRGVPTIQDQSRMSRDPVFRAFGESAIRALQQCSPLRLPPDKYAMWQDLLLNFDPKQLVGP